MKKKDKSLKLGLYHNPFIFIIYVMELVTHLKLWMLQIPKRKDQQAVATSHWTEKAEGREGTHRLVPHLGVQGGRSGSSGGVGEGVRQAWGQFSGVERIRSPRLSRCRDQCCSRQVIYRITHIWASHTEPNARTLNHHLQQVNYL